MASSTVLQELSRIQAGTVTTPGTGTVAYDQLLQRILGSAPSAEQVTADLKAYLDAILGDGLTTVASRALLTSFAEKLRSLSSAAVVIDVGKHALTLQEPASSFEEQDAQIREAVAEAYEREGDHGEAARVLQGIQLESSQRAIHNKFKMTVWIRIVRNLLEAGDTTTADFFLNKAKSVLHTCDDGNVALKLGFQLSHAKILDAQRRFLEASREYYDLSFASIVVDEERMKALAAAMVCAVLAPAGPQRSRSLARLYKDERARQLPEFGILEKMFLDRLLSPDEVAAFADTLADHQLARTADGSTVLERAVIEHNLVGVSKVYVDIGFGDLATLLGQSPRKAEDYAARMIEQGRLTAYIDQINGIIYFPDGDGSTTAAGAGAGAAGGTANGLDPAVIASPSSSGHRDGALWAWHRNVQGLVEEVERVSSTLHNRFPVRPSSSSSSSSSSSFSSWISTRSLSFNIR